MWTDTDRQAVLQTLKLELPLVNVVVLPPMRVGVFFGNERNASITKVKDPSDLLYNPNKTCHLEIIVAEVIRLTNLDPRYQALVEHATTAPDWRPTETIGEDYYAG